MSKPSKKKGATGGGNKDRPNGKAWKKPRAVPLKKTNPSLERLLARERVLEARLRRKEANIARREAERLAAEVEAAELEEIEAAKIRNAQRKLAFIDSLKKEDAAA